MSPFSLQVPCVGFTFDLLTISDLMWRRQIKVVTYVHMCLKSVYVCTYVHQALSYFIKLMYQICIYVHMSEYIDKNAFSSFLF